MANRTKEKKNIKTIIGLLFVGLVFLFACQVCLGTVFISPLEFFSLISEDATVKRTLLLHVRLPRALGCLTVGSGLAVAGVIIQNVLSNPLAAPNIIGVNSAAGCAVAAAMAFMPTAVRYTPVAAFIGAFCGVMLVLFIAEKTGASRLTMILAGVAVSSVFSAITDAVVTLIPDALIGYSAFRIGSLKALSLDRTIPALAAEIVIIAVVLTLSSDMDVLGLGPDTAHSLGLNVKRMRIILLMLASGLAGISVSLAGIIGFVGLIVPHAMRRLVGTASRTLLICSALGGACLLTFCDLASRLIFMPYELPAGIMLSLLGGPFFIFLLIKQRGGRTHE